MAIVHCGPIFKEVTLGEVTKPLQSAVGPLVATKRGWKVTYSFLIQFQFYKEQKVKIDLLHNRYHVAYVISDSGTLITEYPS